MPLTLREAMNRTILPWERPALSPTERALWEIWGPQIEFQMRAVKRLGTTITGRIPR